MAKIRITKKFRFEAAHALYGYDGKCKNIHGHNYNLFVTIIGTPVKDDSNVKYGMVMDFGDLKKIVNSEIIDKFDHSVIFNKNSPHKELADELNKNGHKVILADYQPTIEEMVIDFANRISSKLPSEIKLHCLKLEETETSYSEWFAADN
jgi:6-pyruvoyltetrahydropterin/6-carboxytetrahydropterin synthase